MALDRGGGLAGAVSCRGGGRTSIAFEDFALALGIVDRAATRLPALGTMTEKARVSYLVGDDGLARLMMAYAVLESAP